ncbi:MAG: hypothetical protein L0241_29550 [Planctomycetia bacterium]|nr:hypothetical protein [Planctomycetia bacterium]
MPVVEVSCPACGAKLKAPEDRAGKKGKCKKCGNIFRIPGAPPVGSGSTPPARELSESTIPSLPDELDEVPMAAAVEDDTVRLAPPTPPVDDEKPVGDEKTEIMPPPSRANPAPAPKPAFGSAKTSSAPKDSPTPAKAPKSPPAATPKAPASKPVPTPVSVTPSPAKPAPPSAPVTPPSAKPAPEMLSLDEVHMPPEENHPAPAQASAAPFSFDAAVKAAKPNNSEKSTPKADGLKGDKPEKEESKQKNKKDTPPPAVAVPVAVPAESDNPFAFSETPEPSVKATKPQPSAPKHEEEPKAKKKRNDDTPAPVIASDNPFAFADAPATPIPPKREDEEPTSTKKPREEEQSAAQAPASDEPFGFEFNTAATVTDKPGKSKRPDEGEPDDFEGPAKPRYSRPGEQGGTNKTLLLTGAVAAIALALGIAAIVMSVIKNREAEQSQREQEEQEKKEEPPTTPPAPTPDPPKNDPKGKVDPKTKTPDPKLKDPDPKPKPPDPVPISKLPMLKLPGNLRAFNVGSLPADPKPVDKPKAGVVIDSPFASVKRVFPPYDPVTGDTHVLVQTSPGKGGSGEKLSLDTYSASSGKRNARIGYGGDGQAVPICDLRASAEGVRFLAAVGGKLHVWNVDEEKKLAEGVDPYSMMPEHQKAGLAAAFFSIDLNQIVTVSTAGAVHLFELPTQRVISTFIPPNGIPGKVSLGRSVAVAEGGGSVVMVVGGVIYQVRSAPDLEVIRKHDLNGEVGRSLAIAASGSPGKIIYAFETDADKKKEKAVLGWTQGAAQPIIYRWQDALGEPLGATWAEDSMGGVRTARGAVWFIDDNMAKFTPLVSTQSAGVDSLHMGDGRGYWYVLQHPMNAKQSTLVLLSVPFDDFSEFRKSYPANQPLRAVRISNTGLAK